MDDTTATVRKEFLEDAKRRIDDRIADLRDLLDTGFNSAIIEQEIDDLLAEKDNLPQVLFAGIATDEEIITRRMEMATEGTYPSPIISGGDILEIIPQTGHDDIPF